MTDDAPCSSGGGEGNQAAQEEWQLTEIRHGITEADADDFATAAEVEKVIARWTFSPHG